MNLCFQRGPRPISARRPTLSPIHTARTTQPNGFAKDDRKKSRFLQVLLGPKRRNTATNLECYELEDHECSRKAATVLTLQTVPNTNRKSFTETTCLTNAEGISPTSPVPAAPATQADVIVHIH